MEPHLFHGPTRLAKTTLAQIMSRELGLVSVNLWPVLAKARSGKADPDQSRGRDVCIDGNFTA